MRYIRVIYELGPTIIFCTYITADKILQERCSRT